MRHQTYSVDVYCRVELPVDAGRYGVQPPMIHLSLASNSDIDLGSHVYEPLKVLSFSLPFNESFVGFYESHKYWWSSRCRYERTGITE